MRKLGMFLSVLLFFGWLILPAESGLAAPELVLHLGQPGFQCSMTISPDGRYVATSAGEVIQWDLTTGKQMGERKACFARELFTTAQHLAVLCYSTDQAMLIPWAWEKQKEAVTLSLRGEFW